jgi:hypothetical protein
MHRTRTKLLLPLVAAAALLAACDGGTGSDDRRLTLRLTDAPGDLEQAWVKVEDVVLIGDAEGEGGGRVDLLAAPTGWIDLLTLSGGGTATLADGVVVPAGRYSQLRFVVCDAYVVTRDGDVYATADAELPAGVTADGALQAPSFCSSGLKVKLPAGGVDLTEDSQVMLVDFDVSQSFGHQAGNSGRWVLHPVMRATAVEFAGGIAGTVAVQSGVTLPTCGGAAVDLTAFVPRALAGTEVVASGVTQAGGAYAIRPLGAGTYTLGYADRIAYTNGDSLTWAATAAPASVTVAGGGTAAANYTVTAATCKPKV